MTASKAPPSFLGRYLRYDELTDQLDSWARVHGDCVRVRSLGKTDRGRDIWLLTVGRDPDRLRPAICIDANMHSAELVGTNAALAVAHGLIELHQGRSFGDRMPPPVRQAALDGLYYIIPRVSPDGAEEIVGGGRVTRSAPRLRRAADAPAHWVRRDMNGDGAVRQMRFQHPAGEFVKHPAFAHVMVPRTIEDDGPYFKVLPEGFVEGYDGTTIPFPHTLSDNDSDFNRNFPFGWRAESEGAGHFPGWEPETDAIVRFASATPHIFAWLDLHTFGGVLIRPPFSDSAHELAREDLRLYAYAAELAAAHLGLPTIGALDEMTPDQTKPMYGTLAAWAYGDRGCLAWAIELWDLFAAAGMPKRRPFHLNYSIQGRKEIAALVEWDALHNHGRVFASWQAFQHPQFGDVEIGGINAIHGIMNPPETAIPEVCDALASFAIALMSLRAHVDCRVATTSISSTLTKVDLAITNGGYLPTYVTEGSRAQPWNTGLRVLFETAGCMLVSGDAVADIGHLPGWGRGPNEEANAPFFQRSRGVADVARTWIVDGRGEVTITIGAPRVGWHHRVVTIGR